MREKLLLPASGDKIIDGTDNRCQYKMNVIKKLFIGRKVPVCGTEDLPDIRK